jgi:hypothetical protein
MIGVHEAMFGQAGRFCAQAVCNFANLFDEPLDPLRIRVVLAPIELGPYNRHIGYTNGLRNGAHGFIVGNRHICTYTSDGSFRLHSLEQTQDFIVHELTHLRQDLLLIRHGWSQNRRRGVHRDKGWYAAIAEAAPRYLGIEFPRSLWPHLTSKRRNGHVIKVNAPGRLLETEVRHWPETFRELISAGDPRLTGSSTSVLHAHTSSSLG